MSTRNGALTRPRVHGGVVREVAIRRMRVSGKLRMGVVGAGWWAVANHVPILKSRSDVELVAVCRLGQAELARVQSAFGIPYGTEDFAAMLNEAPMEALVVASPHSLHGAQAIAALEMGIHVLVEKPMTVSAADARAIAGLARSKGLHVLVPYGWNFMPYFAKARAFVRSGRIGRIRHVSAQMASLVGDLMTGSDLAGKRKRCSGPIRKPGPIQRREDTDGGNSCIFWEACST
jgi:Oxidoreductase family, NAD-binding Rossmann fold